MRFPLYFSYIFPTLYIPRNIPYRFPVYFHIFPTSSEKESIFHLHLRPLYLNSQLLSLLFDAQASELSSRMSAMKAATDNAKECRGREEAGARGARGDGVGR